MYLRLIIVSILIYSNPIFSVHSPLLKAMENCRKYGISKSDLLYLLKNDKVFDINGRDESNLTLLMWCSASGRVDTVNTLLENGAKIDLDTNGQTALFSAVRFNQVPIVWRLLKAGANPNRKDKWGLTPLDYATRNQNKEIIDLLGGKTPILFVDQKRKEANALLEKVAKKEISPSEFETTFPPYGPLIDEPYFEGGMTLLHRIMGEENTELLEVLIRLKANVNAMDFPEKNTPLHYAISLENSYAVRRLLEVGADQNIKNSEGASPLDLAEKRPKIKSILIRFLDQKAIKDKKTQEKIISYLKNSTKPSKWKAKIKEHELKINEINKQLVAEENAKKESARLAAIKSNQPAAIKPVQVSKIPFPKLLETAGKSIEVGNLSGLNWALDNGLPPDARFMNGNPIIFQICHLGNIPMLQALVARGANINVKGVDGITPLMVAVKHYRYDVVEYLLRMGADKTIRNNFNWTAFDVARQNRDQRLMMMTKF